MITKSELNKKICKYIDFCYLKYFIENSEKYSTNLTNNIINDNVDWKIFSTCYDEHINILYVLDYVEKIPTFSYDLLFASLHLYNKICIRYAHLIECYTYLFASIYICVSDMICVEYHGYAILSKILRINKTKSKKMIDAINYFVCEFREGNCLKNV